MWFAIFVTPRKEFVAEQLLSAHGYNTYLPLENQRLRVSRRTKRTDLFRVPLLPGYLFIGVKSHHELSGLAGWSFVLNVFGKDEAQQITREEMLYIRKASEDRCKEHAAVPDWAPTRGKWYDIVTGPFGVVGMRVKCVGLIGKKAKKFWAEMGGRLVVIDSKNVEAA